ncbi:MAG: hypothetical protein HDR92_00900 [Bacteroides sp.]|nr:hypothetical protein [Bacteroides sp.]
MRKYLFLLTACLCGFLSLLADTPVDLTEIPDISEDYGPEDSNNRGRRTAPAPVQCLIDFTALTITGSSPKLTSVVEYQLWSVDSSVCLVTAATDNLFVTALLSQLPGEYLIILKGESYSLRGYLLL